jgi:menaquinone-9 beta-reductase
MSDARFDVVVVGGSLAGLTAARLYAQRGLSVALLEKHRDPAHYKRLCTHFIQGSARATIERLGIAEQLDELGAVHNRAKVWTRWGWIVPPESEDWGYSIRREVLDPLLREVTLATPGVDGRLGWTVRDLVLRGDRVDGVIARSSDRRERPLLGRLVVGADGANSTVADLAGVEARTAPNERFAYYAYFRGLAAPEDGRSRMWLLEPDVAYHFLNDDDHAILAAMPGKSWLPAFDADRQATFERYLRTLPDAPELDGATQVSPLLGTRDYPLRSRPPAPRPGLALIGDAATTSDPLWGVGCGWAFQSAEWLVDATAGALLGDADGLGAGIRAYRRRYRHIVGHDRLIADFSRLRDLNPIERSIFAAATHDDEVGRAFERFGTRSAPARAMMSPRLLARTTRVNRRHRAAVGQAPAWRPADDVVRREIVVDGLRSPLLEAGPADAVEAVVCVHGNPGSREDLGHLAAEVGRFTRAVAVDLPGFGGADKPADFPTTVQGYADHLGRVLDHLGIGRAHLVVHDFGGPWGLRWAADHPEALASITLVGTGLFQGYRWHQLARLWQTPRRGEALMASSNRWALHTSLQVGAPRGLPRSYTEHVHATMDRDTRRAILALYRATPDLNAPSAEMAAVLRSHQRPVLVVWGRHDPYLPVAQAYRQRDTFPDARIEVLEHSGHWPFVDDPEGFLGAVVPFLREVTAGTQPEPVGPGPPEPVPV